MNGYVNKRLPKSETSQMCREPILRNRNIYVYFGVQLLLPLGPSY